MLFPQSTTRLVGLHCSQSWLALKCPPQRTGGAAREQGASEAPRVNLHKRELWFQEMQKQIKDSALLMGDELSTLTGTAPLWKLKQTLALLQQGHQVLALLPSRCGPGVSDSASRRRLFSCQGRRYSRQSWAFCLVRGLLEIRARPSSVWEHLGPWRSWAGCPAPRRLTRDPAPGLPEHRSERGRPACVKQARGALLANPKATWRNSLG